MFVHASGDAQAEQRTFDRMGTEMASVSGPSQRYLALGFGGSSLRLLRANRSR